MLLFCNADLFNSYGKGNANTFGINQLWTDLGKCGIIGLRTISTIYFSATLIITVAISSLEDYVASQKIIAHFSKAVVRHSTHESRKVGK